MHLQCHDATGHLLTEGICKKMHSNSCSRVTVSLPCAELHFDDQVMKCSMHTVLHVFCNLFSFHILQKSHPSVAHTKSGLITLTLHLHLLPGSLAILQPIGPLLSSAPPHSLMPQNAPCTLKVPEGHNQSALGPNQ